MKTDESRTLNELLTSTTRARLLTILLTHPSQEYYLRELHRKTGQSLRAVQHELPRLERIGLVVSRRQGRQKYFRANEHHPLFADLKRIVYKTAGLGDALREALSHVTGAAAAFLYGSVAKGGERTASDVDLMVIGTPDPERLHRVLQEAEEQLGREISLVTMGLDEWRQRRAAGDGFVAELMRSRKIFLVGDERALRGT